MVAQAIDGTLDFISRAPASPVEPQQALSLFEAPFVARDWDHVQKMLASPFGQEQLGKLAHDRNMVTSRDLLLRRPPLHDQDKALETAADAKGLKIRVDAAVPGDDPGAEATPTPDDLGESRT